MNMKTFLHVGCGPKRKDRTTSGFADWNELRFDIDESVQSDLVGTMTDMTLKCVDPWISSFGTAVTSFVPSSARRAFFCLTSVAMFHGRITRSTTCATFFGKHFLHHAQIPLRPLEATPSSAHEY